MRFRASLPCRRRAMPFFLGLYKVFAVHARYAHTSREETTRIQSPQIPYSENACFFRILRIDFRSKNPCPWSSVSPLSFVACFLRTRPGGLITSCGKFSRQSFLRLLPEISITVRIPPENRKGRSTLRPTSARFQLPNPFRRHHKNVPAKIDPGVTAVETISLSQSPRHPASPPIASQFPLPARQSPHLPETRTAASCTETRDAAAAPAHSPAPRTIRTHIHGAAR